MSSQKYPRCVVSVTMQPDLHARLIAICRAQDVPVAVWVRQAISEHLKQSRAFGE
jgi:predicted HicB family RNase H-like nuclease